MEELVLKAQEYFYYLHKNPELSNEEYETTKYIIDELEKLECFELDKRTETGVVATYNPGCSTIIAFRADIDALPVLEKTELSYASINEGVMHACGHDFHAANLLAFSNWLATNKVNLTIKLFFQANEEVTPGGSRQIIDNGVLDDVDYVFGLHVDPNYETGEIGIKNGALYASIDDFDIKIIGSGGHVSTPHLAKDPLYCASSIVLELQNAITRRIDPMNPPLIGVGSLIYGDRVHNIISNEAFFCGTIRTHNNTTRTKSIELLNELVTNTTKGYGLDSDIKWEYGEPALINDSQLTENIKSYLQENSESTIVEVKEANYGGEDFSNYSSIKPSLFFLLGGRVNEFDFHNDRFEADPNALKHALNLFIDITNYYNQEDC